MPAPEGHGKHGPRTDDSSTNHTFSAEESRFRQVQALIFCKWWPGPNHLAGVMHGACRITDGRKVEW